MITPRLLLILFLFIVPTAPTMAADLPVNTDRHGVLLNGYDLVSYFLEEKPVSGSPRWQADYRNATLYFSDESNLERFLSNPEAYWPQYSGHCANGLSDGHLIQANPDIYRLIDGRLYLFYSWWGRAQWRFNQESQIASATENWRQITGQTP